ncbi:MAG: 50S ribosomal protein L6 [Nitrospirae bacterium]|nr:50S ribosomal protein L6 [Nitrospirota bacterium]
MSRVGAKPINLPKGVDVKLNVNEIAVKGPKGELKWSFPAEINVMLEGEVLQIKRESDTKQHKALHGTARSIIANMITGVHDGYERVLDITGIGYKAQVQGKKLLMTLGYSHPVEYTLPEGMTAQVDPKQTKITLKGSDKQLIGQVAANIRAFRPPDIYKGKGIRYTGEYIKLKAGKVGKK